MPAVNPMSEDTRIAGLEEQLERERAAARAAERAVAAAEANALGLRQQRAELDATLHAARRRRREASERLKRVQEGFPALRESTAAKRTDLEALERRFDKVRWTLHELEREAEELKARNRDKLAAVETAKKRLKAVRDVG